MKTVKTNNDIMAAIGELSGEMKGTNERLDKLNGSVAKNIDKLAQHDVINAQTTIALQTLTDSMKEVKEDRRGMSRFWYGALLSVAMLLLGIFLRK